MVWEAPAAVKLARPAGAGWDASAAAMGLRVGDIPPSEEQATARGRVTSAPGTRTARTSGKMRDMSGSR
jgi:hypothetical protein